MKKLIVILIATLSVFNLTFAQSSKRLPELGFLLPAGAQRGKTVDVLLYGMRLDKGDVIVDDESIKAEVIHLFARFEPVRGDERKALSQALKLIENDQPLTKDIEEKLTDRPELWPLKNSGTLTSDEIQRIKYQFFFERTRVQPSQGINQTALVRLTIPKKAKPGLREIRYRSHIGISKPLFFEVGSNEEILEVEPLGQYEQPEKPLRIPVTINGQIMPGDNDVFYFKAKDGQKISIKATARELKPYIADGVPGWFEALITLYGPDGKELAYSDRDDFRPDPVLNYKIQRSGVYSVHIRDSIYRGREDFVYRLSISNYSAKRNNAHNRKAFPHKIANAGDANNHPFEAVNGQAVIIETTARAKGSPIDTFIQVLDNNGQVLAQNDDKESPFRIGRQTTVSDSYLRFIPPYTGKYTVQVSDTAQKGGSKYGYHLRIGRPSPGFEVYTSPANVHVISGSSMPITFKAIRKDGYKGPIKIGFAEDYKGFKLQGAIIPAGEDAITAVLTVPRKSDKELLKINFEATAKIGTRSLRGKVIPADDWQQAFLWRHLMPTDSFMVSVRKFGGRMPEFTVRQKTPVKLNQSSTATVDIDISAFRQPEDVIFKLIHAPKGVRIEKSEMKRDQLTLTFAADQPVKNSGNLIVEIVKNRTKEKNGKKRKVEFVVGVLPPIPFVATAK